MTNSSLKNKLMTRKVLNWHPNPILPEIKVKIGNLFFKTIVLKKILKSLIELEIYSIVN